jgi:hypothetical protein
MSKQKAAQPRYMVSIYEDPEAPGALRFTFVPKGLRHVPVAGEPPEPAPQYILSVQGHGSGTALTWIAPPPKAATREQLEDIARARITARHTWLDKLLKLVTTVNEWAKDLGWSTKVVEKRMEDPEIGNYKAPALLLQKETTRLLLEPVARSAPGAEGLVDLYRMPSYDDVASLSYYNDGWNVHYMFEGTPVVGNMREAEAKPLTKATLRKVFDEMQADAG